MTVDQIRERTVGENVNVACPECGEIHLTLEEVEEAEARRITSTRRFQKIKEEAEA
jgi:4-hydroxy-3-methylbut-2-en-1-yl diphosphate synthase IspG/GcpE